MVFDEHALCMRMLRGKARVPHIACRRARGSFFIAALRLGDSVRGEARREPERGDAEARRPHAHAAEHAGTSHKGRVDRADLPR